MSRTPARSTTTEHVPSSARRPSWARRATVSVVAALGATCLVAAGLGGAAAAAVPAGQGTAQALTGEATSLPSTTQSPAPSSAPTFGRMCPVPPLAPGTALWVLCWDPPAAATGPWEIYQLTWDGTFRRVSSNASPAVTILTAPRTGVTGTFYVRDGGGMVPVSVLTNVWSIGGPVSPSPTPSPSPRPIAQPSAPEARACETPAAVCWTPSTTYGSTLVRYDVYRRLTTGYERVTTAGPGATSASVSSLPPGTHDLYVAAFDDVGNVSGVSAVVRLTVERTRPACEVRYRQQVWGTGFTADLTVTNTGTEPLDGWTLRYDLAGASVTGGWNATWSQSDATVTATATSWNAQLDPGESVSLGALGSRLAGATLPAPTAFTLSDAPCTAS